MNDLLATLTFPAFPAQPPFSLTGLIADRWRIVAKIAEQSERHAKNHAAGEQEREKVRKRKRER
jgi:hypothetical protein